MKIQTTLEISKNRIADLLVGALESNIGTYFVITEKIRPKRLEFRSEENEEWPVYDWPLNVGGSIVFEVWEDGERFKLNEIDKFVLGLESIQRGLQIMADKYPHHMADFLTENDDAITSDVFLQCCLFGDVIFS